MQRIATGFASTALVLLGALLLTPGALAQASDDVVLDEPVLPSTPTIDNNAASKTLRSPVLGTFADQPQRWYEELVPTISEATMSWIAVVMILLLTLQTRPLLTMRNLDGLMLAAVALLFVLRDNTTVVGDPATGETVQFWSYTWLTVVGAYWIFRGVQLAFARRVPRMNVNVSEGGLMVLVAAALLFTLNTIANKPLTATGRDALTGARDALVGGIYTAETGKLPYGDALSNDARSPLLFLASGGCVRVWETAFGPLMIEGDELVEEVDESLVINWDNRQMWLSPDVWPLVDRGPVRLLNALLFILLLGAVSVIGGRLHSVALAQTFIVILCVFPGSVECFLRPEITLPATLLAWTVAFALLPGAGLFSMILAVAAGLAWPWAFLALPILLAYWFRSGWQAFGAVLGLLAGAAGGLALVTFTANPALPREGGALAQAGIAPEYAATAVDGEIVITRSVIETPPPRTFKSFIWEFLLQQDDVRLAQGPGRGELALPRDVSASAIKYQQIAAGPASREDLQAAYRVAAENLPFAQRMWLAARTVLEATWRPGAVSAAPPKGAWDVWIEADNDASVDRWTNVRRASKVALGLLALVLAGLLWFGDKPRRQHLVGSLLALAAGALIVAWLGAASNWVWLLPMILASFALSAEPPATAERSKVRGGIEPPRVPAGPGPQGAAPRITVER